MNTHLIEVKFKDAKGHYFANPHHVSAVRGEMVVVTYDNSTEVGMVSRERVLIPDKLHPSGDVIRKASDDDIHRLQSNRRREDEAYWACINLIAKHDLVMNLIDVESKFDGSKLTFFFTAEKRVDFRGLVRDLATMFKGRIEMRQIGVRDEARKIGGFGMCGRDLCCVTWLREFEPITLKMAKEQNLSMTSSKMLGLCGRLMCCLMYEEDFYDQALSNLPRVGSSVSTPDGEGTVYKVDIFKNKVFVRFDEGHGEYDFTEVK
jgi:cell fate regulator YaaT (PSP1 superfamily)